MQVTDIMPSGAIDLPDKRDYIAGAILGTDKIELPKELRLDTDEGNQGARDDTKYACTCYAAYHAAKIMNEREHNKKVKPDYLKGWELQGSKLTYGDYVQNGLKSIVKNGLLTEDNGIYTIEGYAKIDNSEIEYWLAKGYPVVTSNNVTKTNYKKAKFEGVWGGGDGMRVTGHAICLTGYDEKYILTSNSYGAEWGFYEDGTFKIKKEDRHLLGSTYILYDKKDVKYLFKDFTDQAPEYEAVKYCKDMGWIKGYEDGRFGGNDSLTRTQMCTLIYRIFKTKPNE